MESVTKVFVLDGGESISFSRLSLMEIFSIADEIQGEREATARQLAKEEKLDRVDVINLVLDLRSHKPTVQEVLESCGSAQGAARVLVKSLTKSTIAKDKHQSIISQISIPDCLDLSRMLILDVQDAKKEVKVEEEDKSPLSSSPATSAESGQNEKPSEKSAEDLLLEGVKYYGKE